MRQYVIDAFTDHVFAGNPAAVCVMDRWLDEAKMMAITIENNLSETAFAVREGEKYHLRWFTPGGGANTRNAQAGAFQRILLFFLAFGFSFPSGSAACPRADTP